MDKKIKNKIIDKAWKKKKKFLFALNKYITQGPTRLGVKYRWV